jgi:hypothetical protein
MNRTMTGTLDVAAAQPMAIREARSTGGFLIATVICIAATALPNLAYARGGGGGFHGGGGGGFHAAGMGGFHGGGFHAAVGGFHGGGLRGFQGAAVGERSGGWHASGHDGRYGGYRGLWGYDPYLWSDDGLYTGDDASGTSYTSQYWYCANPAGYYPYVTQCSVPWQAASAN